MIVTAKTNFCIYKQIQIQRVQENPNSFRILLAASAVHDLKSCSFIRHGYEYVLSLSTGYAFYLFDLTINFPLRFSPFSFQNKICDTVYWHGNSVGQQITEMNCLTYGQ